MLQIPFPWKLQHKLPSSKSPQMSNNRLNKNEQHSQIHKRLLTNIQEQQETKRPKFRIRGDDDEVPSPQTWITPPQQQQTSTTRTKRKQQRQSIPPTTQSTPPTPLTKHQKTKQSIRASNNDIKGTIEEGKCVRFSNEKETTNKIEERATSNEIEEGFQKSW